METTKPQMEQFTGKSCIGCSLLYSPKCPHAMYIHELDIALHHCSRFKKSGIGRQGLKMPVRMIG
ncbi:hypothetical protein HYU14_05765 [Candidatus Woesearchaeota archaeon]|nr:hypothetical protein [Candidatus Woesearchaeota archaeon]